MKKPSKKTIVIVTAILLPVAAAAIAIPKFIAHKRQSSWRRTA